jgi:zinc transport system substrate-binding protein
MQNSLLKMTACFVLMWAGMPAFAAPARIDITVSIPPQAYFVERIGGNFVSTHIMIPGGANPATYEPTPRQLIELSNSQMYLKVGTPTFFFEKKYLQTFVDRNPRMTVIDESAGVALRTGDPHIWTSPARVKVAAANIAEALVKYDPSHRGEYEKNLKDFLTEIDSLDRWIQKSLEGKKGWSFMIYHPSWGYFADEYGIVQIPIEEGGKPGNAAHIRKMIDLARQKGITDILVQRGFDDKNARTIAAELKGSVAEVDPLARDWPRGLRAFTATLVKALRR